jgi:hypothetical protein
MRKAGRKFCCTTGAAAGDFFVAGRAFGGKPAKPAMGYTHVADERLGQLWWLMRFGNGVFCEFLPSTANAGAA